MRRRIRLARTMKRHGIVRAWTVLREARNAGVPLSLACALLQQESGGGRNVFGHDPVKPGQVKGGVVTKDRYLHYRNLRKRGFGMQGVGPLQLTWWSYQDAADKLGGCWKPHLNMRVGFRLIRALVRQHGTRDGIRRYNGSGPAAERYASEVLRKQRVWHDRLK